jgi:hypothetical protein
MENVLKLLFWPRNPQPKKVIPTIENCENNTQLCKTIQYLIENSYFTKLSEQLQTATTEKFEMIDSIIIRSLFTHPIDIPNFTEIMQNKTIIDKLDIHNFRQLLNQINVVPLETFDKLFIKNSKFFKENYFDLLKDTINNRPFRIHETNLLKLFFKNKDINYYLFEIKILINEIKKISRENWGNDALNNPEIIKKFLKNILKNENSFKTYKENDIRDFFKEIVMKNCPNDLDVLIKCKNNKSFYNNLDKHDENILLTRLSSTQTPKYTIKM